MPSKPNSIPPLTRPPIADQETPSTQSLINSLNLIKHIEGGYFAEIDRNPLKIPNPFLASATDDNPQGRTTLTPRDGDDRYRNASTSIYYLLTRTTPWGSFHRNRGRTVHTVIRGRGVYVLIHADEEGGTGGGFNRVETFVVGMDVERGERPVWIVEGGKYKGSFLVDGEGEGEGLLISETVIPGFEYSDHDFLTMERFRELVAPEQVEEMGWLVREGKAPDEKDLL